MGWVSDRFKERSALDQKIGPAWNSVRDSIGTAAMEYNERVKGTEWTLHRADCTSKSSMCMRLETRGPHARSIEVFIDDNAPTLNIYLPAINDTRQICKYHLNGDHSDIEFYTEDSEGGRAVRTIEQVCEMALSDFLFNPFPLSL
jgi:hypothetical protein